MTISARLLRERHTHGVPYERWLGERDVRRREWTRRRSPDTAVSRAAAAWAVPHAVPLSALNCSMPSVRSHWTPADIR
jgi:hypothetical protein